MSPVRVVADGGDQLGVMSLDDARQAAADRGLDLVEVAPLARPPVVKIMDYGKFRFEQQKSARAARKKQHVIHVKEVKLRPDIGNHDFEFKIRHARKFLSEGNKAKMTVRFRGREMAHIDRGRKILEKLVEDTQDIAAVELPPKMEGRNMVLVLGPKH